MTMVLKFGSLLVLVLASWSQIGSSEASAASSGPGYWLSAADGGVFAFGAPFLGSATQRCTYNCFGFGATASGRGYWIADFSSASTDLYGFGDAPDFAVQTPSPSDGAPLPPSPHRRRAGAAGCSTRTPAW